MTPFNDIIIREGYRTVEVEARPMWTDVYRYLVPKGLNVFGGRWMVLARICVWQDILGKQTSMWLWLTRSRNSTSYH
jgi:hypothetical protein